MDLRVKQRFFDQLYEKYWNHTQLLWMFSLKNHNIRWAISNICIYLLQDLFMFRAREEQESCNIVDKDN